VHADQNHVDDFHARLLIPDEVVLERRYSSECFQSKGVIPLTKANASKPPDSPKQSAAPSGQDARVPSRPVTSAGNKAPALRASTAHFVHPPCRNRRQSPLAVQGAGQGGAQ